MTTAPEFFQKPQRPQQPTNKASGVWIYVPLDQPPPPPSPPPSFPIPVLQHNSILTKPTLVGKSNSIPVITGRQLSDLERQRHLVALQKHKARAKNLETKYTHHNERMQYHAKKLGLTVEDNSLVADTIEVAEEAVETIDQEAIALQRQAEKIRRQHEQRMSQLFVDSTGFLDFGHVPIFPENEEPKMLQASTRTLKIKTGVLSRLVKELNSYEKEHVAQQERIDKLVAAGEDAHTVRKQREVLEETTVMIPDCKNRIAVAKDELQRLVAEILASAAEAAESEEIIAAQEVIRNAPVKL